MDIEVEYLEDVLEQGLDYIELVRVDPPKTENIWFDGSVTQWSLPLKWELIVHHPSSDSMTKISHMIALSDHEGRIVSIRQISNSEQDEASQPTSSP